MSCRSDCRASCLDDVNHDGMTAALGCEDLRVGQLFAAPDGVPAFSGVSAHMVIQIGPG